jgi:hypothetical protein
MPFTPLGLTFVVSCDVYENGPIKTEIIIDLSK